jgi:hypothetical protein
MLREYLKRIKDTRGKQAQQYAQSDVLYICLIALLCGAISYRKMHTFITIHFEKLKNLLGLTWKKPPAYTSIQGIITRIDVESFEQVYRAYVRDMSQMSQLNQTLRFLGCDGKTLRGSYDHLDSQKARQVFSIFDSTSHIIFAHEEIDEKTNEIPVFQKLVKELDLQGIIFTLDALHCQKKP